MKKSLGIDDCSKGLILSVYIVPNGGSTFKASFISCGIEMTAIGTENLFIRLVSVGGIDSYGECNTAKNYNRCSDLKIAKYIAYCFYFILLLLFAVNGFY